MKNENIFTLHINWIPTIPSFKRFQSAITAQVKPLFKTQTALSGGKKLQDKGQCLYWNLLMLNIADQNPSITVALL